MVVKAQLEEIGLGTGSRGAVRRRLLLPANGARASGASAEVIVHNASSTGMLIESPTPLAEGEGIALDLPEAGTVTAHVIWSSGDFYGCHFDRPISAAALSAAELRSDATPAMPEGSIRESLGARLARLRQSRRMSLADVADALELSKPTVWAWEKGRARPADHRLPAIAALYGIELEELVGDTSATGLGATLETMRQEIAAAFGTVPAKVRIMIDL